MIEHQAIYDDIATLKKAIKDNMDIARPTAFNKMQLDELIFILACYEKELYKLTHHLPLIGTESLSSSMEGRAMYEKHEQFKPKNRGL